jgi:hypothetical protein
MSRAMLPSRTTILKRLLLTESVIMRTTPAWRALIVIATLCIAGSAVHAQTAGPPCEDLFRLRIENVNLLSSSAVPAQGDLPAFCRVLGNVRPAINFEVRLPLKDWNGKFYMAGCGGFCGTLDSDRPGFTSGCVAAMPYRRWIRATGGRR